MLFALDIALPRTEKKIGDSHGHKDFDVNVDHNLTIQDDLPEINTAYEPLRQVFIILLSNAIK